MQAKRSILSIYIYTSISVRTVNVARFEFCFLDCVLTERERHAGTTDVAQFKL